MAIYVGYLVFEPGVIPKLNQKHFITEDEVRGLIQWPARIRAAFDDDPVHGPRWVILVNPSPDRELFAALEPTPAWEGARADTWTLRTAFWNE